MAGRRRIRSRLSDPIRYGAIESKNRFVMAPLTRGRSTRGHVPTPPMAEYYRQRASAGLIITEATGIGREGLGWPYGPGVWTPEQVEGWKTATRAVHDAGGTIVCQLWHMGRIVHPSFLDGKPLVSASATTAPGAAHTYDGKQPYAEARPLREDEISRLLEDYRHATTNAINAGGHDAGVRRARRLADQARALVVNGHLTPVEAAALLAETIWAVVLTKPAPAFEG